MSPGGFGARRSVEGGGFTPSRRVDAATGPHGDTRRAGRESAATALLDWAIALLWPALAPCLVICPASVPTAQLMDPDPRDRKSVVEGKSVSVRVDIGGRRFIKKKKKRTLEEQRRIK